MGGCMQYPLVMAAVAQLAHFVGSSFLFQRLCTPAFNATFLVCQLFPVTLPVSMLACTKFSVLEAVGASLLSRYPLFRGMTQQQHWLMLASKEETTN